MQAPDPARGAGAAGNMDLGGFVGAHVFSSSNALGAVQEGGPSIASSIALGVRLGYTLSPLIALESELSLVPTTARDSDDDANVLVIEPRMQARFGGGAVGGVEPFAALGVGLPIALSADTDVIANDILAALHAGIGARFARASGWNLRVEARTALVPARGANLAAFDFEITASLYRAFGADPGRSRSRSQAALLDQDGDGVEDAHDECRDRAEDGDGFEDQDGCPDIDDDRDEILDDVDACRLAPERANGFRDADGCPDVLPPELTALVPDPDALVFGSGSATLRRAARATLDRVAQVLAEHESVRVLIIGHTDDREALDDAEGLSLRRAEVVRDALIERGVPEQRMVVRGAGAAYPATGGQSPRERLQNRRVTLQVLRPDLPVDAQIAPR